MGFRQWVRTLLCWITGNYPRYGDREERGMTFLGRYDFEGRSYDLWHGHDLIGGTTIVARWSPEGPDYYSGMCFGWAKYNTADPLVEARRRAEALGLDVQKETWGHR